MDDKILLVAIIPLLVVIVGMAKIIANMSTSEEVRRSLVMDDIDKLRKKIATVESEVIILRSDNAELKRDNNELRDENIKWRKAARKWYLIAVSINGEFRNQAEDGLDEPTDL